MRVIKTRQDDLMGEPFDNYADLLMIRGKEPLGILARTAPYVIYKRGTIGDWHNWPKYSDAPSANTPTTPPIPKPAGHRSKQPKARAEHPYSSARTARNWNL